MKRLFLFLGLLNYFVIFSQERKIGLDEPFKLFERNKTIKFEQPPKAFKFIDYSGEGSVNTTNGRFEYTVPFYEIKNDFIKLPIGLNYATSGVKMSEDLSCVGVNWNLVAGGKITRKVKGMPDDLISVNKNAFTGRQYHYPNYRGLVPANFGPEGFIPFEKEKYLDDSFMTSAAQHPRYYGSARSKRTSFYMYNFPLRFNHTPTTGYSLGFKPDIPYSEKLVMEELKYESNKGFNDLQRDIFTVNIGDLNFSFILQEKPLPDVRATNFSRIISDWETKIEAIPLDEKGVKIEFVKGKTPLHFDWVNTSSNPTRRRTILGEGIVGFIITDKNGVKYYFNEFEIQDTEYLAEDIDNSYLSSLSEVEKNVKAFQWGLENTVTTSWKISKIVLPNNKKIVYEYNPVIQEHETEVRRSHTGEYKGFRYNLMPLWHPTTNDTYVNRRITTHRLKKIYTDKEEIEFNYSTRGDLKKESYSYSIKKTDGSTTIETGGVSNTSSSYISEIFSPGYVYNKAPNLSENGNYGTNLTNITLKSRIDGKVIRTFDLNKTFYSYNGSSNYMDKRMFFTSLRDSKLERSYSFSYKNPTQLLRKNTAGYQDLWGYPHKYSGSHPSFPKFYVSKNNPIGHKIMYTEPKNTDYFMFSGVDRFVDEDVSNGVLEQISFPTKGYLKIDYEPNVYYEPLAKKTNVLGPGVRVKKMSYYDYDNLPKKIKQYEYTKTENPERSSGEIMHRPSFAYISNDGFDNEINRAQLEYKEYYHHDDSFFISYNKTKSLLKRGKNYGSSNNRHITTSNYDYVLKKLIKINNYPLRSSYDHSGNEIIYKEIKESLIDNQGRSSSGYIKYVNYCEDNRATVKMSPGNSDEPHSVDSDLVIQDTDIVTNFGVWGFVKTSYGLMEIEGKDIYPFPEREYFSNLGRLNGKMKSIQVFDKNNVEKSKESFSYSLSGNSTKKIKNITNNFVLTYAYDKNDNEQKYYDMYRTNKSNGYNTPSAFEIAIGLNFFSINEVLPERKTLLTKREIKENGVITKYNYEYDTNFLLTTKSSTKNSKNETILKQLIYPYQVPSENANGDLISRNINNLPVKSITSVNGVQTVKLENIYKNFNISSSQGTNVLLEKQTKKIKNANQFDKIIYDKYDEHDHLLEYHVADGLPASIIWGYKNQYPIAEVKNVSYQNVMNIFSSSDKNSLINSTDSNTLHTILNKIRIRFPNAMVTTYTYDPLVGLKVVTDPRGYKTYYEYDDFFRLKAIKDENGNILEHYKYQYKR